MIIASFWNSVWNVFFMVLWFTVLFAWLVLVFQVFGDIFRRNISGWAKFGWSLAIIFLPFLGTFAYLIVHGDGMSRRDVRDAEAGEAATRAYIRQAAGTGGPADQLDALHKMHEANQLSDEEYAQAKAKVLNG